MLQTDQDLSLDMLSTSVPVGEHFTFRIASIMVSIDAFQALGPSSILG